MTIASETSRVDLVGDGANDTFTFTFEIYVKTDLLVYVDETEQTVDIEFTVPDDAIENPDGGTIVFGAGDIPALNALVRIALNLPLTQLIDYVEADKFPAETHERGLDRLVKIAQQIRERVLRQPSLLESSQCRDLSLPDPVASKLLAWKDDLSGIKNVEFESEGDLLLTDYIKTLMDDEDAAAALITLALTATAEEINQACDGITATGEEINRACDGITEFDRGRLSRAQFTWHDADEIYIGAAVYECNGKIVYWNSQLTSDIGSPDGSDWYYLYIDDSEIAASGIITTSELIWSNTEPAWSHTKHGWYNGNDRCIFAVVTSAGSAITEFFHSGDYVALESIYSERAIDDLDTDWTDVDCATSIPKFSTKIRIVVDLEVKTADAYVEPVWRVNGSAANGFAMIGLERIGTDQTIEAECDVVTDGSQIFEIKNSRGGDDEVGIYTAGWYFPIGM